VVGNKNPANNGQFELNVPIAVQQPPESAAESSRANVIEAGGR